MAAKEATASALRVVVFLGTVRENNYGSRAGKFIIKKLTERGFQVEFIGELLYVHIISMVCVCVFVHNLQVLP